MTKFNNLFADPLASYDPSLTYNPDDFGEEPNFLLFGIEILNFFREILNQQNFDPIYATTSVLFYSVSSISIK